MFAQKQQFFASHLEVAADPQDVGLKAGIWVVQLEDQTYCKVVCCGAQVVLVLGQRPKAIGVFDQHVWEYVLQKSIKAAVVLSHGLYLQLDALMSEPWALGQNLIGAWS